MPPPRGPRPAATARLLSAPRCGQLPGRRRREEARREAGSGRVGEGRGPYTQADGRAGHGAPRPSLGAAPTRSRTQLSPRKGGDAGSRALVAPGRSRGRKMPVRRGHVAPQNTYLDTIIRKFEGQSECVRWDGGDDLESRFCGRSSRIPLLTSRGAGWGLLKAERRIL